jgi:hypothetical protein
MNETMLKRPATEGFPETGAFWMDHMIAGYESEGDRRYEKVNDLPDIGGSVMGYYDDGESSKEYIFRVIAICLYDLEVRPATNSKSIGAILIDPVMENHIKEAP